MSSSHELLTQDWQAATLQVAEHVGDRLSGTGLLLSRSCKVVMVEGDFRFDPVPNIRDVDDTVELTCNIDAYEEWQKIIGETPGMDSLEVRDLYLGVGVALAELSLIANKTVKKNSRISVDQRISIGVRAMKILDLFQSRDGLRNYARDFEEKEELWGLENLVQRQLDNSQVLRINRLRYGLAVSMFAMDLEPETERGITVSFKEHLKADVSQREETLYEFLSGFAKGNFDEVSTRQEQIQSNSFPELLFAGTIPMDIFEVIQ